MSNFIHFGTETIPIFPNGVIADRINEDNTVCFVCEVPSGDPQEALASYDNWAMDMGWSTVDRSYHGDEWSLLLSKNPIMVNLSQKGSSCDPLLLVTIIGEDSKPA